MTAPAPKNDPTRTKIIAATDRLLAGTPLRSTGRLSVSKLAVEADVGRSHLTHQHVDLKEQFQARVASAANTPAAFTRQLGEFENLKAAHAKLVAHCAELEERLQVYATVINVLSLEKQAAETATARITDIHTPRRDS